jgi:hypothetical protein
MKFRTGLVIVAACASTASFADSPVDRIRTSGSAQLEKVSDLLLFSSSKKLSVQIPRHVEVGDSFILQYLSDGKPVQQRFTVVSMAIRGDRCWIHSSARSREDRSLGDTIYVKPCAPQP